MLNPYSYGVVGNGSTDDTSAWQACLSAALAANTGVLIPRCNGSGTPSIFAVSGELCVSGIDVIGEAGALAGSTTGPTYATFAPTAGARLFKVGPRSSTDVTNGFTDQSRLGRLAIDLTNAPTHHVAIGSDYGVAKRQFHDLTIRGVSGSVASKNFAAFRLGGTNESTNIAAYNSFERIKVFHCADAFDLIASQQMRYDDCHFSDCFVWDAYRAFSLIGSSCQFDKCGVLAVPDDFTPDATPTTGQWLVKLPDGGFGGGSNQVNAFSLDDISGWKRPFIYAHFSNILGPFRDMDAYAGPVLSGGAPDFVQLLDDSDNLVGPTYTPAPAILSTESLRANSFGSAYLGFNLVPNGRFIALTGSVPTRFSVIGSPTFSTWAPPFVFSSPNSLELLAPSSPTGLNGLQIDLLSTYANRPIRDLLKVCVGLCVFVTAAQSEAQGVYLKMDDGVNVSEIISTLRYDGTKSVNALQQQAGEWHFVFLNHEFNHNMTQAKISFGLKYDASHTGTGYILIDHVFCMAGIRDAYTARAPLLPPAIEALLV